MVIIDMVKSAVEVKKEDIEVTKAQLEPEKTIAVTKDTEIKPVEVNVDSTRGPRVLAIVDDSKKSKLMLKELKDRKVNVVSEAKADFKDVVKAVKNAIKSESDKNNSYEVVYLPVTNDDYNKRAAEFSQLRSEAGIPVNLYFQDRSEEDIANRIYVNKIE